MYALLPLCEKRGGHMSMYACVYIDSSVKIPKKLITLVALGVKHKREKYLTLYMPFSLFVLFEFFIIPMY